jgi:hypothetical protein
MALRNIRNFYVAPAFESDFSFDSDRSLAKRDLKLPRVSLRVADTPRPGDFFDGHDRHSEQQVQGAGLPLTCHVTPFWEFTDSRA